ncbi:MAG TPA: multifunctional oxoglutarate decarboxylase/oxoglutarate dehydrogenase thiamine pyrophosphate-binding subunit/dihydrolipoyllysine-residue succinyltransferase subunit, partial [Microbacterium sp.]|nr:multifunctional oxoglutarate decarboxylase/oxoglutarate dehydrogenase thiamine pyrophosphate-binding subunit/dihydrolipoyllysine-residue succinyltransferase subunit [Microbacterium sp.]
MSSQVTGVGVSSEGEFGANEWLVDELYEQYKVDKNSVDKAWWPILEAYQPVDTTASAAADPAAAEAPAAAAPPAEAAAPAAAPEPASPAEPATPPAPSGSATEAAPPTAQAPEAHPMTAPVPVIGSQPVARTTARPAAPQPIPAQAPAVAPSAGAENPDDDKVTVLKGMTKALAVNMDESLRIPTATSVRTIPAKLMIDNRIVINNHMSRTRGG